MTNPKSESVLIWSGIIMSTLMFYFGIKGYREKEGHKEFKMPPRDSVDYMFIGAWNTKYHWGTWALVLLLSFVIYLRC
jgi:hypothetical protein